MSLKTGTLKKGQMQGATQPRTAVYCQVNEDRRPGATPQMSLKRVPKTGTLKKGQMQGATQPRPAVYCLVNEDRRPGATPQMSLFQRPVSGP
ncbi:MAG: hypothetical protein RIQ81_950 [Pseudomonadota bacterium]